MSHTPTPSAHPSRAPSRAPSPTGSTSGTFGTFSAANVVQQVRGSAPPSFDELTNFVAEMAQAMKIMAEQVQKLTKDIARTAKVSGIPKTPKDMVACPKAWTGKGGSAEARHFLAAFRNWASAQGEGLNQWDPASNRFMADEPKWVQAVKTLNLLQTV